MFRSLTLACIAACTMNFAEAGMPPHMVKKLTDKGINVDKIMRRAENFESRAALSIHKSQMRSKRLQAVHKFKKLAASTTESFDDQVSEEEQRVIDIVCDGDADNCDEDTIDTVEYTFDVLKGIAVGMTAQFSGECRSGLVGIIDSSLNIYNHIEFYIPSNLNKFTIAFNDFTQASNICYAYCDVTHMYSELAKLTDWKNWEQYIELASRVGGVMIEDMWTEMDIMSIAREAGDGYASGQAVGDLTSLFMDTLF